MSNRVISLVFALQGRGVRNISVGLHESMEMKMSMVLIVMVVVLVGGLILFLIREQFSGADFEHNLVGIWFNENLNVRILMYDVDSVFQGSIVWADDQNNSILGLRVVENLKVGFFNVCKGTYVDPKTTEAYDVRLQLKGKAVMRLSAYNRHTHQLAFVQEWKLMKS